MVMTYNKITILNMHTAIIITGYLCSPQICFSLKSTMVMYVCEFLLMQNMLTYHANLSWFYSHIHINNFIVLTKTTSYTVQV